MAKKRRVQAQKSEDKKPISSRKKKQRRRRRLRVFFICLLVLLLFAGVVATGYVFLRIENIELILPEGSTVDEEALLRMAGIERGKNLYSFDRKKAVSYLEESYPELEYFSVKRKLPNRVVIEAQAAVAQRSILVDEKFMYVGKSGKILSLSNEQAAEGSMIIYGLTPLEKKAGKFLQLSEEENALYTQVTEGLQILGKENIKSINLADHYGIIAVYNDNVMIELGSVSQLSYKLEMVKTVIDSLEPGEKVKLDASIAGKVTKRTWYDE